MSSATSDPAMSAMLDDASDVTGPSAAPGEAGAPDGPRRPSPTLCSWRRFHDRLREAAIRSAMVETPLAILVAEVRGLEKNDDPHRASIIRLFAEQAGADGAIARYGQDTLVGILPHTDERQAAAAAELFRQRLPALAERHGGGPLEATVVAVSGYDPEEPLAELVERAFARLRSAARTPAGES